MKRLLFLCLLLPLTTFAQKEIPSKTNSIILVNKNTAYANFTDVRLLLTKMNIEIADLDKDRFQIKTGSIVVNDQATAYFDFDCRDDKITVTGKWKSNTEIDTAGVPIKNSYLRIDNSGTANSIHKAAFEKMNALAKKFGTVLTYEFSKYLD